MDILFVVLCLTEVAKHGNTPADNIQHSSRCKIWLLSKCLCGCLPFRHALTDAKATLDDPTLSSTLASLWGTLVRQPHTSHPCFIPAAGIESCLMHASAMDFCSVYIMLDHENVFFFTTQVPLVVNECQVHYACASLLPNSISHTNLAWAPNTNTLLLTHNLAMAAVTKADMQLAPFSKWGRYEQPKTACL